jgi:6-pyruvoyltetrahydropterin/6-carboxytetrahydropterin synthase
MKIRKEFRVESAHIVRNCTSHRCSHSIHGHSAVVEVFLEGNKLDNAHMLYDFGLMKGTVKEFIDSMDHCYILCSKDSEEFRNFIKDNCDRWIELPFNPSAEMLSVFIFKYIQHIIYHTNTSNGEGNIKVNSVRYHETTTGYAECNQTDAGAFWDKEWEVDFSDGVIKDWSKDLKSILFNHDTVTNPIVEQQINLN